jgi:ElaA protein
VDILQLFIKTFDQLTNDELYEILKLRVDIFVVEQTCPYPDLDDLDQAAIHVFYKNEEGICAYLRVMDRGVESEDVSIGRVVVDKNKRRKALGSKLMQAGIKAAREIFDADTIYLEAQRYAKSFYEKQGFKQVSEVFLLDDIPHIKMELKVN